jgi:hypothetical protein
LKILHFPGFLFILSICFHYYKLLLNMYERNAYRADSNSVFACTFEACNHMTDFDSIWYEHRSHISEGHAKSCAQLTTNGRNYMAER